MKSILEFGAELEISDWASFYKSTKFIQGQSAKLIPAGKLNLGQRKQHLLEQATGDWILILDSDELVSPELRKEIREILKHPPKGISGFRIPYQNYVFGKPVYYGGENYSKIRLFRRGKGRVTPVPIHEEVIVEGKIGTLSGKIHHYSYRTPIQVFRKFTRYAILLGKGIRERRERVTLRKLFLDPIHMIWARYVKDQGYKDGWRGFVLAVAFGYMEAGMYWCAILDRRQGSQKRPGID
ncbi:MAG: glycosyltransferase family 2 protein [bacterium]|nr:glycosyltransferase family 2 protein [bacterium]